MIDAVDDDDDDDDVGVLTIALFVVVGSGSDVFGMVVVAAASAVGLERVSLSMVFAVNQALTLVSISLADRQSSTSPWFEKRRLRLRQTETTNERIENINNMDMIRRETAERNRTTTHSSPTTQYAV